MYTSSLFHFIFVLFTVTANNASKRKKKQETTSSVNEVTLEETDVEEYVAEKFAKKTKIPPPSKQGKNNGQKGSQPGPSG